MSRTHRVLFLVDGAQAAEAGEQLGGLLRCASPAHLVAEVALVWPDEANGDDAAPLRSARQLDTRGRSLARATTEVARMALAHRATVLHATSARAGALAAAAAVLVPRLRVVWTERGPGDAVSPREHFARWIASPRAELVLATSRATAARLRSRFGLAAGRVGYLPDGLDQEPLRRAGAPDAVAEHHFEALGTERARLLVWCEPDAQPEASLALHALAALPAASRPAALFATSPESGLDALAGALGLSDTARFLDPAHTPLASLFRSADAVLWPVRQVGFPTLAAHALAAGKPVLAPALGDLPSWLAPGLQGWTYPPGNQTALAAALEAVAASGEEELSSRADACREVVAPLTFEALAEDTLRYYDAISA